MQPIGLVSFDVGNSTSIKFLFTISSAFSWLRRDRPYSGLTRVVLSGVLVLLFLLLVSERSIGSILDQKRFCTGCLFNIVDSGLFVDVFCEKNFLTCFGLFLR